MQFFLWIFRLIAAIIMLQTLYFKFSASEESVYIFSTLKMEPWGRIGIGIAELIASVLILIPKTSLWGALLAMALMVGAILSHFKTLGIVVKDDGGQLFFYALIVFVCSAVVAYSERHIIIKFLRK
jgi:hypothetical protein